MGLGWKATFALDVVGSTPALNFLLISIILSVCLSIYSDCSQYSNVHNYTSTMDAQKALQALSEEYQNLQAGILHPNMIERYRKREEKKRKLHPSSV